MPWAFGQTLRNEPWGDPISQYEGSTAVHFWMRRSIDGTDNEFMRAVIKLLQTYDPDYPLPSLPDVEELKVELEAKTGPNAFQVRILKANVPQEKLGIRILSPSGKWIITDRLEPLLEGAHALKAQVFWKDFIPVSTPSQSFDVRIEGSLKQELDELVQDLGDESFRKRQSATITIQKRGRHAQAYLQEKLEALTDPERIHRLRTVLKAISQNPAPG